ncbi:Predicted dehydrogenase [Neorhodopirellula lusitana]|uniref:Predicted dehydrogenase n=1 Tax=Neorhodopirellula lusitana TaxID=445327 RepID=A0ABY1Q1E3_9BACT|nr:Gfo/Idh/MocA family oxidoreductase [Neorhodopirellula lusitana]SMP54544.1 Predicted dehydrogenase [Neorhodopirellula lusitana]
MTQETKNTVKVLCVGAGNMGRSHALAYHKEPSFEIVGICTRSKASADTLNAELESSYPHFSDFEAALRDAKPDAVCIASYPDTHAEFAKLALEAGCHLFVEKPLATTVADAEEIVALAKAKQRKVVIGYILRHHPSWEKFIELTQDLGKPLVMRMNLNQQSSGSNWETHKNLMSSISPIVDCGVHYVDVMCQMTRSRPVRVSGIGARLSDELPAGMVNYGQLQVTFEDGSVGWYEAGWGPMMSETAFFVKDVVGPKGCVSIVADKASDDGKSASVDAHTQTEALKVHHSKLDEKGEFVKQDEMIHLDDEPDHDELCAREQAYFLRAMTDDIDLTEHLDDAVNSMRIVLAADESFRTGKTIELT